MKLLKTTIKSSIFVLILGFMFVSANAVAEVVIIANTASGAESIDAKTAKKVFLGKITSIPGMENITLIDQKDSNPIKAEFTKKITKKRLDKYKAYWSKRLFSGKGVPPSELGNDLEVKSYITSHVDAIGYISAANVDNSVKVLFRAP